MIAIASVRLMTLVAIIKIIGITELGCYRRNF